MIIKKVSEVLEANKCDELLNKLILDERKYNDNIDSDFIVKDFYKNYIDNNKTNLLIAVENSNIIGYIFTKIIEVESEKKSAKIDALYIEEVYRNKGIATKLIEESINWIKDNSIDNITINVMYQNEVAKKLYYKLGFENYSLTLKNNI